MLTCSREVLDCRQNTKQTTLERTIIFVKRRLSYRDKVRLPCVYVMLFCYDLENFGVIDIFTIISFHAMWYKKDGLAILVHTICIFSAKHLKIDWNSRNIGSLTDPKNSFKNLSHSISTPLIECRSRTHGSVHKKC